MDLKNNWTHKGSLHSTLVSMKNDGTFDAIDDLAIDYDGNRLLKVTDDAEALNYNGALDFDDGGDADCEYQYDSNGALTYDGNRGITSISYDYGHHPSSIISSTKRKGIYNIYTPDGRKLSSQHVAYVPNGNGGNRRISSMDLYVDGLILRGGKPLMWQFDGGYVSLDDNGAPTSWNYYVTDHLGSTRMVVGNDSIRETINYYPFGSEMTMQDPALMTNDFLHPYRFTGKELDRVNGLNMYDFGARWFDVAGVPMWTSVDPLAEKYYNVSPYVYCAGNPINYIDPDGRSMGDYYNTSGKQIGTDGLDDEKKYMVLDSDEQKLVKAQETTSLDDLSSVIPVPSNQVINAMETAFKKTEETGREYGFRVGVNGTVTSLIGGTENDLSNWDGPMAELRAKGEYAAYDVHTHPMGDSSNYGLAQPSPTDIQNVIKGSGQPSVVLGYNEKPPVFNSNMIGGSTHPQLERGIGFYNSGGIVGKPMSFNQFQRAVKRINR